MKFQSLYYFTKAINPKCCWRASYSAYHSSLNAVDLSYAQFCPDSLSTSSPIFILHGFLGSKQNWRGLAKAITKDNQRKVYTLDARNHGDSPHSDEFSYSHMSEDVIHLMNKLSLPKISIIGHSMGGRTAMSVALNQPNLVDKLVVVDVSPIKMPKSSSVFIPAYMLAMVEAIPLIKDLGIVQARKIVYDHLSKSIPEEAIRQFLLTNLAEKNNKVVWKPYLEALQKNFVSQICDFSSFSGYFPGETLFISGGESPYVKEEDYSDIRKLFPKAQFVVIEGAGHWVHSERPKEFLEAVHNFL